MVAWSSRSGRPAFLPLRRRACLEPPDGELDGDLDGDGRLAISAWLAALALDLLARRPA
jgi:hypothetical protein